jgi:uncharacterized membrane protein
MLTHKKYVNSDCLKAFGIPDKQYSISELNNIIVQKLSVNTTIANPKFLNLNNDQKQILKVWNNTIKTSQIMSHLRSVFIINIDMNGYDYEYSGESIETVIL